MTDRYAVQRIMEIIAFVMSELRQHRPLTQIDVDELHRRGYTESEISAALSWIMERTSQSDAKARRSTPSKTTSFRVLHDLEHDLLTPEAWGMLLSYRDLGFLSNDDLEQILERAVVMGAEGGVDAMDVSNIIAVYLMNQQQSPIAGSKSLLDGSETIN
jgi:uncharacterized protein Smg (DUF494 family)